MPETVLVVVPAPLEGERVDRVVSFLTGLARADAAAVVDDGGVTLRGLRVTSRSTRVHEGDDLEIVVPDQPGPPAADPAVAVAVVYEDAAVIVVDKAAGLVVHPGAGNPAGTLVNGLLARYPDMAEARWPDPGRPGIVHRIDKGTSGLLMVARSPEALLVLSAQLEDRLVERRYLALVWGAVDTASGLIDAPIGRSGSDATRMTIKSDGKRAVTRYEVVRRWEHPQPTSLIRCTLETGRTHQIRVHLSSIGHPVVGDDRYLQGAGGRQGPLLEMGPNGYQRAKNRKRGVVVAPGLGPGRPFLHAGVLGFDHPTTGERMRFESDLPPDLSGLLDRLSEEIRPA